MIINNQKSEGVIEINRTTELKYVVSSTHSQLIFYSITLHYDIKLQFKLSFLIHQFISNIKVYSILQFIAGSFKGT